ncbi:MAG: hypothetical protein ACE37F_01310 [Nannocystaceae bacterium]|nr:hypothetical protein [bacterium]
MTRSSAFILLTFAGCAGGDQNQPGGVTLGGSASGGSETGVATTGISASGATSTDPSATSGALPTSSETGLTSQTDESGESEDNSSSGGTPVSWNRYSLDTASGTWSQAPLSELWVGGNAPPPTGVTAAVSLTRFDRLLVATDDGMIYERADGVWQTPLPLSERFPLAAGLELEAMVHSPGQGVGGEMQEDIYLIDSPQAAFYVQLENGGLENGEVFDLVDEEDGPPQASQDFVWSIAETDPSQIGMDPDWLVWHHAFANGEVWRFNAGLTWTEYSLPANAYFSGAAGEPDPTTVRAAFFDDAFGVAHFIAP